MGGPKPVPGGSAGVTVAQLRRVMPNLSQAKAEQYLPYLNQAMAEANITTPQRKAAFLAQLAHESGELRYMEEIASGAAYEGRTGFTRVDLSGPADRPGEVVAEAAARIRAATA